MNPQGPQIDLPGLAFLARTPFGTLLDRLVGEDQLRRRRILEEMQALRSLAKRGSACGAVI